MRPVFFLKNKYGLAPSLVVLTVRHRYVPALRENRTLVVQHVHIIIRSVFFFFAIRRPTDSHGYE